MNAPRKLPVLRETAGDERPRPPWRWVVAGVVLTLSLFAPAAIAAAAMGRRASAYLAPGATADEAARALAPGASPSRFLAWIVVAAALPLFGFALASGVAGAVIGRFGGKAGVREATASGALSAVVLVALAAARMPLAATISALFFLGLVGVVAARLGAERGVARRVSGS